MNITVVHGGTSTESAISTQNAKYIAKALEENGHQVRMLLFNEDTYLELHRKRPDLVFIAVQGKNHGDGTMQSLCEVLKLPYTGSKAAAAALINNKSLCKSSCAYHRVRTPEYLYFSKSAFFKSPRREIMAKIESQIGFPVVAKGVSQGGSFGLELITTSNDYDLIANIFSLDDEILIERFIRGKFVTTSVLEIQHTPRALPTLMGFNDASLTGELVLAKSPFLKKPAEISQALLGELEQTSLRVFDILGGKSYGRVDFMIEDDTNLPYFLEINAVPGLKPQSFFPQAAEKFGISFNELIKIITDNEA